MVDISWGSAFLLKGDEKDGLVVMRRQDNEFVIHSSFKPAGKTQCLCWATEDLILVGLEPKKGEAKIEVVSLDQSASEDCCMQRRIYLEKHSSGVKKIITTGKQLRAFSQSESEIILWDLVSFEALGMITSQYGPISDIQLGWLT